MGARKCAEQKRPGERGMAIAGAVAQCQKLGMDCRGPAGMGFALLAEQVQPYLLREQSPITSPWVGCGEQQGTKQLPAPRRMPLPSSGPHGPAALGSVPTPPAPALGTTAAPR